MYLFVLFNTLYLLPIAAQIWGPDALMPVWSYKPSILGKGLNLLFMDAVKPYFWWFIAAQLVFLLLGILGRLPRIAALVIYFTTANLLNSAYPMFNGGINLLEILLLYLVFMNEDTGLQPTLKNTIWHTLTNTFFTLARLQIAYLYFVATVYKLAGNAWLDGEALYYVLSIDEFSHPWLQASLLKVDWLLVIGTYLALAYQLLFPLLVWFNKTRKPLLIVGVVFHLFIAFGVGLFDFGIIMILSYSVYLSNDQSRHWLNRWSRGKRIQKKTTPE